MTRIGAIALLLFAVVDTYAQTHFTDCYHKTGVNATVIFPDDGVYPFASGDEVAVLTPDGHCAGALVWDDGVHSLPIWGDDQITPNVDGLQEGDTLAFRYFDGAEEHFLAVTYSQKEPFYQAVTYRSQGLYVLSTVSLNVASPEETSLVGPEDEAVGIAIRPVLHWAMVEGALSYHVQVASDTAFVSLVTDAKALVEDSLQVGPLTNGTRYHWRVRAVNSGGAGPWSPVSSFTVVVARPEAVEIVAPESGVHGVPRTPTLQWSAVEGADRYAVQVDTSETFSAPFVNRWKIFEDSLRIGPLAHSARYYWRVRAINEGGAGLWSATYAFDVIGAVPGDVAQRLPEDGADGLDREMMLDWAMVAEALYYDVQVDKEEAFGTPVVDVKGLVGDSLHIGPLDHGTRYYWRVRAVSDIGAGAWSPGFSFTVVSKTAVEEVEEGLPQTFALYQNYPNPFNPRTTIRFDLPDAVDVSLVIYDALGREITTLVSQRMTGGRYQYEWDGSGHPSGLYLYRLQAGNFSKVGTMMFLK